MKIKFMSMCGPKIFLRKGSVVKVPQKAHFADKIQASSPGLLPAKGLEVASFI